jgi:hypothetical protein
MRARPFETLGFQLSGSHASLPQQRRLSSPDLCDTIDMESNKETMESARLLGADNYDFDQEDLHRKPSTTSARATAIWTGVLVVLLVLNVAFLAGSWAAFPRSCINERPLSYCTNMTVKTKEVLTHTAPAADSATYTVKSIFEANHSAMTPFSGDPNDANIRAWEDLIQRKSDFV